jgi:hypothetical protein
VPIGSKCEKVTVPSARKDNAILRDTFLARYSVPVTSPDLDNVSCGSINRTATRNTIRDEGRECQQGRRLKDDSSGKASVC